MLETQNTTSGKASIRYGNKEEAEVGQNVKLERGQAGIAGEYAVMSELILNGFAVGMTGGNSKEIDLLCRDIGSGKATSIQVKTQKPDVVYKCGKDDEGEHFAFQIAIRDKNDSSKVEQLKEAILSKQIYYAFYVAGRRRVFIAMPEEVVSQLDEALKERNNWLYFRVVDNEATARYLDRRSLNYDMSVGYEGENGYRKLR